jgi:hypothetical protein
MSHNADLGRGLLLSPVIVEAIAQRVAELLRADLAESPRLLTASQVAERFAVSRKWVYEHAEQLGGLRLGQGPRARLRFDAEIVSLALDRQRPTCSEGAKAREESSSDEPASGAALLPIYGALGGQ